MRIRPTQIKKSEKDMTLNALYQAAARMKGDRAAATLVDTLLTESERLMLGRRILIAQLILAGDTQREICARLNVSPNTVSMTRKWLTEQIPEYDKALKAYQEAAAQKKAARDAKNPRGQSKYKEYPDPLSFAGLKQRYPMHFLLFNLAEALLKKSDK